ncbi:19503_t:CDS:10, partial [Cetraspora pellucida]
MFPITGFKLLKDIDTQNYEVVVVSPSTPLLASSSVGTLEFRCVTEPVRRYSPKIQYYQAYADSVDLKNKLINCTSNLDRKKDKFNIQYDTLVVAVGANSNTFGIPGVGDYALFLKDISDARKIRQRVIECFEHASQPNVTKEEATGLLHFAVVGGGPTGVEFSAELHDFITQDMARLYPNLINSVSMTVYDIAPQILGSFDQSLRDYAIKKFTRKGINIRTGTLVKEVKERHLIVNDIGEVPYGMLVWATGLTDNPLTRAMGEHIMKDKSAKRYAIGDCATIKDYDLPATAQVANQKAKHLRKALTQIAQDGGSFERVMPFQFTNLGSMVYIGEQKAVVDFTSTNVKAKERGTLAWEGTMTRGMYSSNQEKNTITNYENKKTLVLYEFPNKFLIFTIMTLKAVAILRGDKPEIKTCGIVTFTQENENAPTTIDVNISGLEQGQHGFHVHEFGDNTNGCTSAGEHYNPFNKTHGAPTDENRHLGDLGNLTVSEDGTVKTQIKDNQITLTGPNSVVGRSVVVHVGADDFGKGGHELSLKTGNSGPRIACGII